MQHRLRYFTHNITTMTFAYHEILAKIDSVSGGETHKKQVLLMSAAFRVSRFAEY